MKSSREQKFKAASIIQKHYRAYLQDKKTSVTKNDLLPEVKANDKVPLSRNKDEEKSALFFHVDRKEHNVFFKKRGYQTLFPISTETNKTNINVNLLSYYLNKGIDIRPFALEAYLRGRVDKHALISLFQIQHATHEFCGNNKNLLKTKPTKVFQIHRQGHLTKEAEEYLLSYLIKTAPPFALSSNNKQFEKKLNSYLASLPNDENFFCMVELPLEKVYKIGFFMLTDATIDQEAFTKGDLKNTKEFFKMIADSLNIQLDVNSHMFARQVKYSLLEELEKKVFAILKKENKNLKASEWKNNLIEQTDLFDQLISDTLTTTGEFIPIGTKIGNEIKFHCVIIGSKTHNAWLKAATDKDPEELVKKIPMLSIIDLYTLNELVIQGQRPIGLLYDGLPAPKEVHNAPCIPFSYIGHDLRFHYPAMFYLRAHADPIYQIQLTFVNAFRKITGHHTDPRIVGILDFANPYFHINYSGSESAEQQIRQNLFIPKSGKFAVPATIEYIFILVCDLIKNEKKYTELFGDVKENDTSESDLSKVDFLIQHLLTIHIDDISPYIWNHKKDINQFSHSLGVFACLFLHYFNWQNNVFDFFKKLNQLEQANLITFKWNINDGLMLNIDNESYRFRGKNDYRNDKNYPPDGIIRKRSNEPNWFQDLNKIVDSKMKELENKSKMGLSRG